MNRIKARLPILCTISFLCCLAPGLISEVQAGPSDSEIRGFMSKLAKGTTDDRFNAAKKLGTIGLRGEKSVEREAVNALFKAMTDTNKRVAIAARLSLGEILRNHFSDLRSAIRKGKTDRAAAMTRSLLPDITRVQKVFKESMPTSVKARLTEFYKSLVPNKKEKLAKLLSLREKDTEVRVYSATTEELREPAAGSLADRQFPGGARRMAVQMFRPGKLFFEVQCTSPKASRGIRYHLFFWDGQRWTMLGPVWRALR